MNIKPCWDRPTEKEAERGALAIFLVYEDEKFYRLPYDFQMLQRREQSGGDLPRWDYRKKITE